MSEQKAIKIFDILKNDNIYIIPRYQRNYAWGKPEISQLISDIDEFFQKEDNQNKEVVNEKKYYLGSLVCFKREDGSFELIDGQQRYTTLTLINLVLKNWDNIKIGSISQSNLKFDSRKKAQNYLDKLHNHLFNDMNSFLKSSNDLNVPGVGSFKDAIEIIYEELKVKERNEKLDIEKFANNFYENVKLFRIEVPQETDLNHYFEIMNNRGEQLEKHEIVKALLMGKLNDSDSHKFAMIWDACSEMGDYIYFNFNANINKILFSDTTGELIVDCFDMIKFDHFLKDEKDQTLLDIIDNHNLSIDFPKEEKFTKEKYKSIIDFPNFLLQVLKIKFNDVSLDDKKLLDYFNKIDVDSKEFIFDLLKYRTLFDKYVIKKDVSNTDEYKQNWGVRKLNLGFETTIKTYDNDDYKELIMLQVMLYYSNSTNTYNNWLQEILNLDDFELKKYTNKLFEWTKAKFQKEKNDLEYPNLSIFNLYYIDFLIWKLYDKNIKGNDQFIQTTSEDLNKLMDKIYSQKEFFRNFKFKQLNSREHLFSQDHAIKYNVEPKVYNGIGNLCLISTSQNSAANNQNPIDKKKQFKINDIPSLKLLIMFNSFNDDKWEEDQIKIHKDQIEALLEYKFN